MKCCVALNNLGFTGLNGELPWKSTDDLKHFKRLTDGCTLLVGWKTYDTLPNLPGRKVIIDVRDELLEDKYIDKIDWCIGGRKTYDKYAHLFTELHISHINDNTEGDTPMFDVSKLNSKCKVFHYYYNTNE